MVITGKRLQRRACKRIKNSPCLSRSDFNEDPWGEPSLHHHKGKKLLTNGDGPPSFFWKSLHCRTRAMEIKEIPFVIDTSIF
jgi:hypothetical protein